MKNFLSFFGPKKIGQGGSLGKGVWEPNFPPDSRIHALPDPSRVTLVSSETYSNNANNPNNPNNPNIPIFSMCSEILQGSSPKT